MFIYQIYVLNDFPLQLLVEAAGRQSKAEPKFFYVQPEFQAEFKFPLQDPAATSPAKPSSLRQEL